MAPAVGFGFADDTAGSPVASNRARQESCQEAIRLVTSPAFRFPVLG